MTKIKIALMSDLHQEFRHKKDPDGDWLFDGLDTTGVDVCVLAGDIMPARNSKQFLRRICKAYPSVIMVAGNHEFYQSEFDWVYREMRRAYEDYDLPNFHFLEQNTVGIKGQRFVGCTLWYEQTVNSMLYMDQMNDFKMIHREKRSFKRTIFDYAWQSRQWLKETVRPGDIVVTHMLPTEAAIDPLYRGDPMNIFYAHNCEKILDENKPKAWLHGHSHQRLDMMVYETRLIRNPGGYPNEPFTAFDKNYKIDL